MYESYLIEVPELNETLDEINKNRWELVSMIYVSDSQQIVMVVKKEEKRGIINLFKKEEE